MAAMNSRLLPVALVLVAALAPGCSLAASPEPAIESAAPPSPHVVRDLVGPGCDAYVRSPASGPGSAAALAQLGAAAAIGSHPQLVEFDRAITGKLNPQVDLAAQLDAGDYTIFAPADSAFAKLPSAALTALGRADSAAALTDLLQSHVIRGQHAPDDLAGEYKTLNDRALEVTVKGDRIRVDGQANVVCGGLRTVNATLYLIDGVLMPPSTNASPSASPSPTNTASGAANQE